MNINYVEHSDGTKLFSFSRHDYQQYEKDNEFIMIDGGFDYIRFAQKDGKISTGAIPDLIQDIRKQFKWWSGVKYLYLKDLTASKIFNILFSRISIVENNLQLKAENLIFLSELQYRHNSNYHDINKQSSK